MTYLEWNQKLCELIFSSANAGKPVSLCLSFEQIDEIGNFDDFVAAVEKGVPGRETGLCALPLNAIRGWQPTNSQAPPFLAFLVFFVYAASVEGDFARNAYYDRVRDIVSPQTVVANSFPSDVVNWMFEWLEKWANLTQKGERGTFRHFVYGSHRHVGPLLAQTVLSEGDRDVLPWIFERSDFDPSSPPHENEILEALRVHGKSHFRVRTARILEANTHDTARQILADLVLAELLDWDGRVPQSFDAPSAASSKEATEKAPRDVTGSLRLCLEHKAGTGYIKASLRCKTPIEFPEDGFSLENKAQKFLAHEWDGSWSCPLQDREGGRDFDAKTLDWSGGLSLRDSERGWKFRWRPSEVRLLTRDPEGVLGELVEVFALPMGREAWILAADAWSEKVDKWGHKCGRNWQNVAASDLPGGWKLWKCAAITDAARKLSAPHPVLSVSTGAKITFHGGVRASRANRFFDFALPRIELDASDDAVLCWKELGSENWREISREDGGFFSIPDAAISKSAIRLSARHNFGDQNNEKELAAQSLYIERTANIWRANSRFDSMASSNEPLALGGLVSVVADGALIYIGRRAGEIARFPLKPDGWEPVWILTGRNPRKAIYCGSDLKTESPTRSKSAERGDLKDWKAEIKPQVQLSNDPQLKSQLQNLWRDYLKLASQV